MARFLPLLVLPALAGCPVADCDDAVVVEMRDADGDPIADFSGTVTFAEDGGSPETRAFSCAGGEGTAEDGIYCRDGALLVETHAEVLELDVESADGTLSAAQELTPAYTEPASDEECASAVETVTLEACADC